MDESPLDLVDESTVAVDRCSGRDVVRLMQTMAPERRNTILLVTRDYRMLDIVDRVIMVDDGYPLDPVTLL